MRSWFKRVLSFPAAAFEVAQEAAEQRHDGRSVRGGKREEADIVACLKAHPDGFEPDGD